MIYLLSLLGVATVLLAVLLTSGRRTAKLSDLAEARQRLLLEQPDLRIDEGLLSGDGKVALFLCQNRNQNVAIVFVTGIHLSTRLINLANIFTTVATNTLILRTDDFTHPIFMLHCTSSAEAEDWANRLRAKTAYPQVTA